LPSLWVRGDVHSLLVAILFSWVFCFAWLATFVWPEWLATWLGTSWLSSVAFASVWASVAISSIFSALKSAVPSEYQGAQARQERQANLELAQEYYLQANYFEAEKLVRKNSVRGQNDVESMLLWISILRRTKRVTQALELISQLEMLDAAVGWLAELRSEKEQCLRIKIQLPPAHD
jgi:hypothetical protein